MAKFVWRWCCVCQFKKLLLNWQDGKVQKAVRQDDVHVNVKNLIAQTPAAVMIMKNARIPTAVKKMKVAMKMNHEINFE